MDLYLDRVDTFECSSCGGGIDVSGFQPFELVSCPHCEERQRVPGRLGQYLLQHKLGQGGMAVVFRGLDSVLKRPIAVKILSPDLSKDEAFVKTFVHEAEAIAALNHPNVIKIYDYGEVNAQHFIVMELAEGDTLKERMGTVRLGEEEVLDTMLSVAQGLEAAAEVGLVHGDVSPANVFIDGKGVPKIGDFGLARFANVHLELGTVWGTPFYIPPERVLKKNEDYRGDMYSLGASLYHLLAGKPPFQGESPKAVVRARLEHPAPDLRETMPEAQPMTAAIIARLLQLEPAYRYPTYASLLADLRKALAIVRGESTTTAPVARARSASSSGGRKGWVIGLVSAVVLAVGIPATILAVKAMRDKSSTPPPPPRAPVDPAPGRPNTSSPSASTSVGQLLFKDSFDAPGQGWSNQGRTAGQARIGPNDAAGAACWTQAGSPNNGVVMSELMLPKPIVLKQDPISMDIKVRVADLDGGDGNKFQVTLLEAGDKPFFGINIRPGDTGRIVYEDSSGASKLGTLAKLRFASTKKFYSLRLLITPTGSSQVRMEAFYFHSQKKQYISIGKAVVDAHTVTGKLVKLRIAALYRSPIYLDEVTVSRMP